VYLFGFGVGNILLFCKKKKKKNEENVTRTVLVVCLSSTPSSDVPGLFKAGKASVGVKSELSVKLHDAVTGRCTLFSNKSIPLS